MFQIRQTTRLLPTTMFHYDNSNYISSIWFHDADDEASELDSVSDDETTTCDDQLAELYESCCHDDLSAPKWGVCLTCGVGLNDDDTFVVDRQDLQSDNFTCDGCFVSYFGYDALYNAVNWHRLGKPKPQHTRFEWAC